jgi:hypothetical protein
VGLWPATLLGARRSLIGGAPPAGTFAAELNEYEDDRHGHIVACARTLIRSALPVGWRAEDLLGSSDGFVPLAEAAETMGLAVEEVVQMVRAGLIEANGNRVRPALVSVLAVKDARQSEESST